MLEFVTYGVLKNYLLASMEAVVRKYAVVIVDEVHEGSVDIDVVLNMLKNCFVKAEVECN